MLLFQNSFLKERHYRALLATAAMSIGSGAVVYHYLEGWSWIDSFYFSVITLTTVGYGDFSPQTDMGKLFTIFYVLTGIGIIFGFINAAYQHKVNVRKKYFEERRAEQNLKS